MKILISACLLGINCRYNGAAQPDEKLIRFVEESGHCFIHVCPECLGGLPVPRAPAEIIGTKVRLKSGEDVTQQFYDGAERTLAIAKAEGCELAILKERSPSCGCGMIYDGTFTGTQVKGNGITAQMLLDHGFPVYGESQFDYAMHGNV